MAHQVSEDDFSEDILINHFYADLPFLVEPEVLKKKFGFKTKDIKFDHIKENMVLMDDGIVVNSFTINSRLEHF